MVKILIGLSLLLWGSWDLFRYLGIRHQLISGSLLVGHGPWGPWSTSADDIAMFQATVVLGIVVKAVAGCALVLWGGISVRKACKSRQKEYRDD